MSRLLRRVSLCFAAGAAGALVNSLVVWYFGQLSIPQKFGVAIAPALTPQFLYPRLVWGGLWGGVFLLLPIGRSGFKGRVLLRGAVLSLFPTLFALFYVYPVLLDKGAMGLSLGKLTPVFVVFYNFIWGIFTALWLRAAESD